MSTTKINRINNEKNAKLLEKKLVDDINHTSGLFKVIDNEFVRLYGLDIKHAKRIGEKKHVDTLFTFKDDTTKRCEVKSSKTHSVSKWKTPWHFAGQFLNGTGLKFRIILFYANEWYKKMPLLKEKFKIEAPIPEYDDWIKQDVSPQKATTDFGIELHSMSKEKKDQLKEFRTVFVKELVVPDQVVDELIEDYIRESKKVLDEKDCWLCICGDEVKLFDKIKTDDITIIERVHKSVDLYYKVKSNIFKGIRIRWQNGVGIANISVQCT